MDAGVGRPYGEASKGDDADGKRPWMAPWNILPPPKFIKKKKVRSASWIHFGSMVTAEIQFRGSFPMFSILIRKEKIASTLGLWTERVDHSKFV